MANCPKCGVKLSKFYWKPNCPNCNVNIFYCGMEERLERDAELADASLTNMYNILDRVKAGYVGSKLAIVRLALTILPIAALFLPLATLNINVPFVETTETINAIAVYTALSTMDFGAAFTMFNSELLGNTTIYYVLSLVTIALAAVLYLLQIIFLTMACAKRGHIRNVAIGGSSVVLVALSGIFFHLATTGFNGAVGGSFTGSLSFGYFILLALTIAPVVINFMIKKNPIVVVYTAEKRKAEIAKKAAEMAEGERARAEAEAQQKLIEDTYAAEQAQKEKANK